MSFEQYLMWSGCLMWGNLTDTRSQIPCWLTFLVSDGTMPVIKVLIRDLFREIQYSYHVIAKIITGLVVAQFIGVVTCF